MSAQSELDDLAAGNGWNVHSVPGESAYLRGGAVVTVQFSADGTRATAITRTDDLTVRDTDWKGQVGNILRTRYRTYERTGRP